MHPMRSSDPRTAAGRAEKRSFSRRLWDGGRRARSQFSSRRRRSEFTYGARALNREFLIARFTLHAAGGFPEEETSAGGAIGMRPQHQRDLQWCAKVLSMNLQVAFRKEYLAGNVRVIPAQRFQTRQSRVGLTEQL